MLKSYPLLKLYSNIGLGFMSEKSFLDALCKTKKGAFALAAEDDERFVFIKEIKKALPSLIKMDSALGIAPFKETLLGGDLFSPNAPILLDSVEALSPKEFKELEVLALSAESIVILGFSKLSSSAKKLLPKLAKSHSVLDEKPWEKLGRLKAWVFQEVKKQDKAISQEALEELIQVSSSLEGLKNEIAKLIQFLGQRVEITSEDIALLCKKQASDNGWETLKYTLDKEWSKLEALIDKLCSDESGLVSLVTQFRYQCTQAAEVKECASSLEHLAKKRPGLTPWRLKKIAQSVDNVSMESLRKALIAIFDFEVFIRKSNLGVAHLRALFFILLQKIF